MQHSTEGGWGALNYQRHIDVEVARFARTVADAIERATRERRLDHLVLSGDTTILPPLMNALPESLLDRVDGIEHFERWDSLREISSAVWPRVAEVVRVRRDAEVDVLVAVLRLVRRPSAFPQRSPPPPRRVAPTRWRWIQDLRPPPPPLP